jgi:hypothetical protein
MHSDTQIKPATVLITDSISDEKAIEIAEKLAKRLGKKLVVSDASGRQIWIAEANPALVS